MLHSTNIITISADGAWLQLEYTFDILGSVGALVLLPPFLLRVLAYPGLGAMGSTLSVLAGMLYPPTAIQCLGEMFPGTPQWSPDSVGSLAGKVALVTGANTGIGLLTALELAKRGAKVYATARSEEKGKAAVSHINEELSKSVHHSGGAAVFLQLDLLDPKGIQDAVQELSQNEDRLDILLNSGGIFMPNAGCTETGIELHFATNVLGHYALTRLLAPMLARTAASSPPGSVRVVNVASIGIAFAPPRGIRFDDLAHAMPSTWGLYGQSKIGNCIFAYEFARRYKDAGIISLAVNPGNLVTDIWRHYTTAVNTTTLVHKYPAEWGAQTLLYACAAPDISLADTGRWIAPWARKSKYFRKEVTDAEMGTRLWDWCEQRMTEAGVEIPKA